MPKLPAVLLATLCLSSTLATTGCALAASTQPAAATMQAEALELDLQKGEILQFILVSSIDSDKAAAVRSEYFQTVIPAANALGAKSHGFLPISATLVGEGRPQGISVFTFPNQDAQDTFRGDPDWDVFKQMRRDAWDQLDVFSVEIPDDMTLNFDPAKYYTIAAAWTRPGTMPDYQRYLDGIEADFESIGARYVVQLNGVALQTLAGDADAPSQLTIVEWSDGPNLRGLQKTQSYKDHIGDFQTAITRFDLYAFKTPNS